MRLEWLQFAPSCSSFGQATHEQAIWDCTGAGRIARCLPPYEAASDVAESEATATADPLAPLFASLPPSDILYISQSSSMPLDSAADAEGSSRYRVEGGAVGEWFKAGANWEEVQRILGSAIPTRKEMDSWDL